MRLSAMEPAMSTAALDLSDFIFAAFPGHTMGLACIQKDKSLCSVEEQPRPFISQQTE